MSTQTVLLVVGSRPEAIKLAPVVFALQQHPERFDPILCSTGQQRDLIPQALAEFGLEPLIDLDVMEPRQSLARLTSRLVAGLDEVLTQVTPDWVLVQGDTTSAMAGALAAFYRHIPVGHVEAGLRTANVWSPFPEEVNRRIISQCAAAHFAPTARCRDHLTREGVSPTRVTVTGNTVIDALLWIRDRVRREASTLRADLIAQLEGRRLVFVTTHRRESVGRGIANICDAIRSLVCLVEDIVVVLPVHPNPAVRDTVVAALGDTPRVVLLPPQPYRTMVDLMDRAYLLLTDSGGLQEEAPALGTPVLVLRETTERPEGIDAGVARLVGTDTEAIVTHALELLHDPAAYAQMARRSSPYGDGAAAIRIAGALQSFEGPAAPVRPMTFDDPLMRLN
jgi:UDP-N-acetylglucosamine 2-epimerase